MGDPDCDHRWEAQPDEDGSQRFPDHESCAYYNLLFEGRGTLFDALRRFDPRNLSDPVDDLRLWEGEINAGWLFEVPGTPSDLAALRRLKRRYFFEQEHEGDGHLARLLPTAVQKFNRLVSRTIDAQSAVENLVEMINTFFAPRSQQGARDYRYRLRLWNSHRYATGEAPAFFAMRALPADKLTLYHPRLASPLADAMALRQDHVLLGVRRWQRGDPALRVDWPLYQALVAARDGRPLALQPFQAVRRLDLFLRSLGQDVGGGRSVEQIEWSEPSAPVRVNRPERRYERQP